MAFVKGYYEITDIQQALKISNIKFAFHVGLRHCGKAVSIIRRKKMFGSQPMSYDSKRRNHMTSLLILSCTAFLLLMAVPNS